MQENNVMLDRLNLFQRIRFSIFPGTLQRPEYRERYRNLFNSLILHFRPRNVQQRTLRFTLTWGLGGMAVVLVCMLFATGLMLKFVYQPVPDRAYESILHLQNNVLFGQLIRNGHHWSGNLLLIIVFLHFLRVFFTGAFHPPRQFNWIIGLALFLAVLTSNITGYLLPWDQLAYWAITICTGILQADGIEVPACSARIHPMDLKSRGIKKPDWALASLGVMAELGKIISPEMLVAALKIRFKGKILDTALELVSQIES